MFRREQMKYVGSKNKLAKDLVPIIQSYITNDTKGYLEPFVGGANMIDKIKCDNKIGCDAHEELIHLLRYLQTDNVLQQHITEEQYNNVRLNKDNYPKWYVGFVGFCATFGAKYFGGYARSFKADGITPRDQSNESIRNIEKQRPLLKNIKFYTEKFQDQPKDIIKGYVIYCDPPYECPTKYSTDRFPHEEFWDWCREMSKENIVLVSEYNAPDDFECIWSKSHKTSLNTQSGEQVERLEKLFIIHVKD